MAWKSVAVVYVKGREIRVEILVVICGRVDGTIICRIDDNLRRNLMALTTYED